MTTTDKTMVVLIIILGGVVGSVVGDQLGYYWGLVTSCLIGAITWYIFTKAKEKK